MARVSLSPPWIIFYKEVEELFKDDPGVRVLYDEKENEIKLYVEDGEKAEALSVLLPETKTFGSVTMIINVIPGNDYVKTKTSLYEAAFKGNPILSYIKTIKGIFTNDLHYVVFVKKVVQYFNDDLGDVNGMCSTLYQEIAKDVFGEREGVFFCTDAGMDGVSVGKPLGEWP